MMEPMLPPEGERSLEDVTFELASQSNALAGRYTRSYVKRWATWCAR